MPKKLSIILIAVIFGAILVFAKSRGFLDGGFRVLGVTAAPIGRVFVGTGNGVKVLFSGLFNLGELQEENAALGDENNKLKAEVARLIAAEVENQSLRKEVGFLAKNKFSYQAADVIAYDPSNLRGMVTINKGTDSGIRNGMAVTAEGLLLGRVSEAGQNTSKVQLAEDPTSAIPVSIQGTRINGIAKGEIGTGITMQKIPQGENFKIGDVVITSGLGGEIPRGIINGSIENISSQENSLFASAKIKPGIDVYDVLRVLVIKGQ